MYIVLLLLYYDCQMFIWCQKWLTTDKKMFEKQKETYLKCVHEVKTHTFSCSLFKISQWMSVYSIRHPSVCITYFSAVIYSFRRGKESRNLLTFCCELLLTWSSREWFMTDLPKLLPAQWCYGWIIMFITISGPHIKLLLSLQNEHWQEDYHDLL